MDLTSDPGMGRGPEPSGWGRAVDSEIDRVRCHHRAGSSVGLGRGPEAD
jgi:hypothetical protein